VTGELWMRRVGAAVVATLTLVPDHGAVLTARTGAASTRAKAPLQVPATFPESQTAVVRQYCTGCHNDKARTGGLSLSAFDGAHIVQQADVVEKMIHKLRAGMMPPAGARRPDAAALTALAEALETTVDAAATSPSPGWRPFQRLNRAEYARAVRDLLDVDVDTAAFLPADTISNGFDNVADAQTFSPALMEGYLRAASKVSALAMGDPDASASEASYKLPKTASQLRRADGAPLGTRGGLSVVHNFPADGEYAFRMDLYAEPLGLLFGSTAKGEQLEVSIDGARVALFTIDPRMSEEKTGLSLKTPPISVKAGPQRVTAAFLQRFEGPNNDLIAPIEHTLADTEIGTAYGITTLPHLRSLNILGPTRITGVSDTPSRHRIFSCRPTRADEEMPCATEIVRALATKAFRGPVSDRHFARLMRFYDDGRTRRDFEFGIGRALEAILASPQFVFRLEPAPSTLTAGQVYRLPDLALASRLSFFLWDAAPDQDLLKLATLGKLGAPDMVTRQVTRMLTDPRSEALSTRFAAQWLRLQDLDKVSPDPIQFPLFDKTLADGLKRETELFFDSIVRENRSVLDLLTADYTFVNERVARHYGIPHVSGNAFHRVTLPEYRRGLLGQGSILTLTSNPDRTSPVQRGKWVLEVLLGSPPPPPPPNVPPLEVTSSTSGGRILSVRQRMEEHRANPACTSCHRVIDPLGLALDNFDATGTWRIKDGAFPVDATGVLYDGSRLDGPGGLRDALLRHKDAFLLSFTERLMTYALGRRVEAPDMPTVRRIIHRAAADGYRLSSFIQGVVESPAFRMSTAGAADKTITANSR
jgi:hypothetical protein